ncbi:hypothetical protein ACROYT_G032759 [Oculina patagonica]
MLNGSSGLFASPGYPVSYTVNLDCLWTLRIPANGSLRLQFIVFEIEPVFDFVELADSLGQRIEILDGSRSGFNVTIGGDRTQLLRIRFFSDSIIVRQGFLAQYNITFVTAASSLAPTPSSSFVAVTPTPTLPMTTPPPFIIGCGGMLNGSSGSFASPGYPVSYTVNLDCLWTLRIPANGSLRLQFIVFETEAGFDFVELTDSSGQRIARLNGSRSGFTVTVRGDRTQLLNIRFFSDFIVVRQGFLAQYNITVASAVSSLAPTPSSSAVIVTPTPTIPVTTPPPFIGCGGMLNGSSGLFASPGYPVSYTVNLDCLWTLHIPANGSLRLQFIVFETEAGFDFVELADSLGQRIEILDGSRSGFNVTIGGDRTQLLRIRFFSDSIIVRQGFLAQYNITFVTAASSLAPTPSSSSVAVTPTSTLPMTTPPPFIIGCGGMLNGSSGSFASPGYPVSYTVNLDCLWTLRIPANGSLRLQFIVFETEAGFDFVELNDSSGQRIARLNGSRSGFTVTVRGDRTQLLNIRFFSDFIIVRQGFLAQYNITVASAVSSLAPTPSSSAVIVTPTPTIPVTTPPPFIGCGGMLNRSSGLFASPGYPVSYTVNLDCLWTLRIPANGSLRLQFIVFETEAGFDFVELADSLGQRIEILDGSRSGFNVTIGGDRTQLLRIRFFSDSIIVRQGFLAQFNITFVSAASSLAPTPSSSSVAVTPTPTLPMTTPPPFIIGCGGMLNGSSGLFASPGYPVSYTVNLDCLWTLRIPANGSLRLQFIVFETEAGFDFVELTDSSGQRIARLNGSRSGFTVTVRGDRTQLLNIRFFSDFIVVRQGFLAQYNITVVSPSSSVVPPLSIPPDVRRILVDLLGSLCQIIQRLQALLGGSFSTAEFENFRNQTLQILQQAENQLISSSSSQLRNFQIAKRSIPELSNPQDLVQALENIQRRLLG